MWLLSNLPLSGTKVRYLFDKELPSIHTHVKLRSGETVGLIIVHPYPPRPPHHTTKRDAELLLVGKKVKQETIPYIVAGDLNDVGWSATTRLFQSLSQLRDPRIGRGFYATFPAFSSILRYPLDHLFASSSFSLVGLEVLSDIGSDHLPLFVTLYFQPEHPTPAKDAKRRLPPLTREKKRSAAKKIEKGEKAK